MPLQDRWIWDHINTPDLVTDTFNVQSWQYQKGFYICNTNSIHYRQQLNPIFPDHDATVGLPVDLSMSPSVRYLLLARYLNKLFRH